MAGILLGLGVGVAEFWAAIILLVMFMFIVEMIRKSITMSTDYRK